MEVFGPRRRGYVRGPRGRTGWALSVVASFMLDRARGRCCGSVGRCLGEGGKMLACFVQQAGPATSRQRDRPRADRKDEKERDGETRTASRWRTTAAVTDSHE